MPNLPFDNPQDKWKELILKYLDGELDDENTLKLSNALEEDPEVRELFRGLSNLEEDLQNWNKPSWKQFNQEESNVKSISLRIKIASAVAIFLLGTFFLFESQKQDDTKFVNEPITQSNEPITQSNEPVEKPNSIVKVKPENLIAKVDTPKQEKGFFSAMPSGGGRLASTGVNLKPEIVGVPKEIRFNEHVRPILSDKCYFCHGPDENDRGGDLRLDIREEAIAAEAFIPGNPDDSEMIYRIEIDEDDEDLMPPEKSHKSLTQVEKDILRAWVASGAKYEEHWAYSKIVNKKNQSIDSIVEKTLKEKKITFSKPALPRELHRRLSLDLTGLPPEVNNNFDTSTPSGIEKYIDSLIASPHYGERMAVWWLDAVRYADTIGYHSDAPRPNSEFRNYVIRSFNSNKPFDVFTREQIAGDLLPDAGEEQYIAAVYNRLNQSTEESGAQDEEYIKKYQSERVRTTSSAWLGSTLQCAECHDHKFDPFTTKDFYRFAAFFSDIFEKGAWNKDGKFNGKLDDYLSDMIHTKFDGTNLRDIQRRIFGDNKQDYENLKKEANIHKDRIWNNNKKDIIKYVEDKKQAIAKSESVDISYKHFINNKKLAVETSINKQWPLPIKGFTAIPVFNKKGKSKKHRYAISQIPLKENDIFFLHVHIPYDNIKFSDLKVSLNTIAKDNNKIEKPISKSWKAKYFKNIHKGWHRLEIPLPITKPRLLKNFNVNFKGKKIILHHIGINRVASKKDLPEVFSSDKSILENKESIFKEYIFDNPSSKDNFYYSELNIKINDYVHTLPSIPAVISAMPREVRILPRGDWMNKTGEVVLPATPSFLPQFIESTENKRLTRLDLANWIMHENNPLTARVFMNRLWSLFFENAISTVPEDFGMQGQWPDQPELLDYLASEFIQSNWNIKHMVKLIVSSRVYQQNSVGTPKLAKYDPGNKWLARQTPRRLDGEFIRDSILKTSDLLNSEFYGNAVFPYQPKNYWQHLKFPDREYVESKGKDQYRRGLYTHIQRTFLHPMMLAFDVPNRDECLMKRKESNTPMQALVLMNDPSFVEAARALADQLSTLNTDDLKISTAFNRVLFRDPVAEEKTLLKELLTKERQRIKSSLNNIEKFHQNGYYKIKSKNSAEVMALSAVTRTLYNLHESITRY